jgi:hypothetical protein
MHDSQQIANEQRNLAAHVHHASAEHRGQEDHLSGHERSRQDLEHSNAAYLLTQQEHQGPGTGQSAHGIAHEARQHQLAAIAYSLWQERGSPVGSPEEDWARAVEVFVQRNAGAPVAPMPLRLANELL